MLGRLILQPDDAGRSGGIVYGCMGPLIVIGNEAQLADSPPIIPTESISVRRAGRPAPAAHPAAVSKFAQIATRYGGPQT